jgi:glycosyltransferase involved in cell wall biosynthesis
MLLRTARSDECGILIRGVSLKILVFTHQLEIGGTQVNAIELAAALRDSHRCEVALFSTPGPMIQYAREKELQIFEAPFPKSVPSFRRMLALRDVVRSFRPDILHVWDWWQCLDAYYAVHLPMRIPMIVSDMMMSLTPILPKKLPTTFGVPEIVDRARLSGRDKVEFIPPPVDTILNSPDLIDPAAFRRQHDVGDEEILLVTVSRLASHLKGESLFRSIDAVRILGNELPLRFAVVGDGNARPVLERAASEVNSELGRKAIFFAGPSLDPRTAYAAADIVLGMGGSALRAMAMCKPVIVMGEQGFSSAFTPETSGYFLHKGIYGIGKAPTQKSLVEEIRALCAPELASSIGRFSRDFVLKHFSLNVVATRLAQLCRVVASQKPAFRDSVLDGVRTAAIYMRERRFVAHNNGLGRSDRLKS